MGQGKVVVNDKHRMWLSLILWCIPCAFILWIGVTGTISLVWHHPWEILQLVGIFILLPAIVRWSILN